MQPTGNWEALPERTKSSRKTETQLDEDEDRAHKFTQVEEESKEIEDVVMAITANSELAQWIATGEIMGINSKEEEDMQLREWLNNYGPEVQAHVTEIYSPPRVTAIAERLRLIPGLALDLTTIDPDDGEPWNFDIPEKVI